ncbi:MULTISPECIES: GNAT family N-acetyltransferase [unclassified Paenibacillus]|uniref:GNAT family N-acetyltransferase n=1 Tax=unclassified Paenibacillus TaxID=185978 RepID=UPI0008382B10|nr:GNAT family N-acetyltransferase [Paenibacillus sp. GM2]NWL89138.1 GNAT family N-acetyltransferase [Paenibacillus sp. 79R4]
MIRLLSLQDPDVVEQIWSLQHMAYRLEALAIGLASYPPLGDTFDSIRSSGEDFYGYLSDELEEDGEVGELLGVISISAESSVHLSVTRLMVHPDHLREGIGAALVSYVLDHYDDIRHFSVTAGTLNAPAVSLYRKFGFMPGETVRSTAGVDLTLFHLDR